MRSAILLSILFSVFQGMAFSQVADSGKVEVIHEPELKTLLEKWQQSVDAKEGKTDGFRVQIHFGVDKTAAKEVKTNFQLKFPGFDAYELYDQPNFKIRVGDFRTKLDAYRAMKEISVEFPGCFIVEDKIGLPKVE